MGMKELILFKNQLGRIVDTGILICDEVTGYFQSNMHIVDACHLKQFFICREIVEQPRI